MDWLSSWFGTDYSQAFEDLSIGPVTGREVVLTWRNGCARDVEAEVSVREKEAAGAGSGGSRWDEGDVRYAGLRCPAGATVEILLACLTPDTLHELRMAARIPQSSRPLYTVREAVKTHPLFDNDQDREPAVDPACLHKAALAAEASLADEPACYVARVPTMALVGLIEAPDGDASVLLILDDAPGSPITLFAAFCAGSAATGAGGPAAANAGENLSVARPGSRRPGEHADATNLHLSVARPGSRRPGEHADATKLHPSVARPGSRRPGEHADATNLHLSAAIAARMPAETQRVVLTGFELGGLAALHALPHCADAVPQLAVFCVTVGSPAVPMAPAVVPHKRRIVQIAHERDPVPRCLNSTEAPVLCRQHPSTGVCVTLGPHAAYSDVLAAAAHTTGLGQVAGCLAGMPYHKRAELLLRGGGDFDSEGGKKLGAVLDAARNGAGLFVESLGGCSVVAGVVCARQVSVGGGKHTALRDCGSPAPGMGLPEQQGTLPAVFPGDPPPAPETAGVAPPTHLRDCCSPALGMGLPEQQGTLPAVFPGDPPPAPKTVSPAGVAPPRQPPPAAARPATAPPPGAPTGGESPVCGLVRWHCIEEYAAATAALPGAVRPGCPSALAPHFDGGDCVVSVASGTLRLVARGVNLHLCTAAALALAPGREGAGVETSVALRIVAVGCGVLEAEACVADVQTMTKRMRAELVVTGMGGASVRSDVVVEPIRALSSAAFSERFEDMGVEELFDRVREVSCLHSPDVDGCPGAPAVPVCFEVVQALQSIVAFFEDHGTQWLVRQVAVPDLIQSKQTQANPPPPAESPSSTLQQAADCLNRTRLTFSVTITPSVQVVRLFAALGSALFLSSPGAGAALSVMASVGLNQRYTVVTPKAYRGKLEFLLEVLLPPSVRVPRAQSYFLQESVLCAEVASSLGLTIEAAEQLGVNEFAELVTEAWGKLFPPESEAGRPGTLLSHLSSAERPYFGKLLWAVFQVRRGRSAMTDTLLLQVVGAPNAGKSALIRNTLRPTGPVPAGRRTGDTTRRVTAHRSEISEKLLVVDTPGMGDTLGRGEGVLLAASLVLVLVRWDDGLRCRELEARIAVIRALGLPFKLVFTHAGGMAGKVDYQTRAGVLGCFEEGLEGLSSRLQDAFDGAGTERCREEMRAYNALYPPSNARRPLELDRDCFVVELDDGSDSVRSVHDAMVAWAGRAGVLTHDQFQVAVVDLLDSIELPVADCRRKSAAPRPAPPAPAGVGRQCALFGASTAEGRGKLDACVEQFFPDGLPQRSPPALASRPVRQGPGRDSFDMLLETFSKQ
ncbi:hypothetical protein DIPPA_30046 [Diplonema papillatum]|nr:hypothetical protein DIPPA_30046 [Diplonema papillatum]